MVQQRDDVVGLDAAILAPPAVWEASGHLANFTDPLVDCKVCQQRFRARQARRSPHLPELRLEGQLHRGPAVQPDVQDLRRPGRGATAPMAYLRPRRRRACSSNFANVLQTSRKKPPFGIAQVGKSFRNEITPRQLRSSAPASSSRWRWSSSCRPPRRTQWYEYWCGERLQWYVDLGIPAELLRLRAHDADELSHYSSGTSDVEFLFPWGWDELEGIANRTDYDLTQHAAALGREARLLRPGHGRALRAPRHRAGGRRDPDDGGLPARRLRRGRGRRRGAARCCACTPGWRRTRWRCCRCRRRSTLRGTEPGGRRAARGPATWCDYDDTQSIGKRYRRQDEIGTPLAVTVDFDSLDDKAVTIRDRDTTEQVRVPIDDLADEIATRLGL